jgi:hypothetical protein
MNEKPNSCHHKTTRGIHQVHSPGCLVRLTSCLRAIDREETLISLHGMHKQQPLGPATRLPHSYLSVFQEHQAGLMVSARLFKKLYHLQVATWLYSFTCCAGFPFGLLFLVVLAYLDQSELSGDSPDRRVAHVAQTRVPQDPTREY